MLLEEVPSHSPYIHLIRRCKSLIRRHEWVIIITHCYREANRAANWLANYEVNSDQKMVGGPSDRIIGGPRGVDAISVSSGGYE